MTYSVITVSDPETVTMFSAISARQAAEKMVYFLRLSARKPYIITETEHGFCIELNSEPLFWVRK